MVQPQAIRFAASHLHWLTRAEDSHGSFQLDALLDWWPPAPQPPLQFVLAAAVPAGHMYAPSGPLLKQPPYSFQLIAGHQDHTILRRPLDARQPAVTADSSEPHGSTFQALSWQLSHRPAQQLRPEALAALPSREELLAKLLGTMQAPTVKFVQTLNEVPTSFVRALAAVRDQREQANA